MTKLIFVDKSDAVFQYHHRDWGPWKLDPIEYTIDYYHPNTPNCPFYSIELDRCFVISTKSVKKFAIPLMRCGVVWIQVYGAFEMFFCRLPLPQILSNETQRCVRFCK